MFECAPTRPHIQPPASIIEYIGLTPSRLHSQALARSTFFRGSAVTASVTAEGPTPPYTGSHQSPGRAQHRQQMQGGQPVMLICVHTFHHVTVRVRERKTRWDQEGAAALQEVSHVLVEGERARSEVDIVTKMGMLISSHSCCYTSAEEALPL